MIERFEKVATLENEIEALCLKADLEERGVPHAIHSYHDSAYDGLFQVTRGWGHVEAPQERAPEILQRLQAIREQALQPGGDDEQLADQDDDAR
ncbi:MAG: hypothetical protein ACYC6Y_29975 [Thermoguttaceae bacterium]